MFSSFEEGRPKDQDYGDYHIFQVNKEHLHWGIKTLDGSKLPARLEGVWTHLDRAKHEIDALCSQPQSVKVYE